MNIKECGNEKKNRENQFCKKQKIHESKENVLFETPCISKWIYNIIILKLRFPSGMKALGEYIHNRGLKYGIYEDYGKYIL